MQETIVNIEQLANVLGIRRSTMFLYANSYLFNEFTIMDRISKPGKSFEFKIILNDNSVPIIRKYLKSKEHNTRKSYVEKFDAFLGE